MWEGWRNGRVEVMYLRVEHTTKQQSSPMGCGRYQILLKVRIESGLDVLVLP